jgi:hypothetical protein
MRLNNGAKGGAPSVVMTPSNTDTKVGQPPHHQRGQYSLVVQWTKSKLLFLSHQRDINIGRIIYNLGCISERCEGEFVFYRRISNHSDEYR